MRVERIVTHIIDRTFVDQNTRWIIDYKTHLLPAGMHYNLFKKQLINRYTDQLTKYKTQLDNMYPGVQIKIGLYLTSIPEFIVLQD